MWFYHALYIYIFLFIYFIFQTHSGDDHSDVASISDLAQNMTDSDMIAEKSSAKSKSKEKPDYYTYNPIVYYKCAPKHEDYSKLLAKFDDPKLTASCQVNLTEVFDLKAFKGVNRTQASIKLTKEIQDKLRGEEKKKKHQKPPIAENKVITTRKLTKTTLKKTRVKKTPSHINKKPLVHVKTENNLPSPIANHQQSTSATIQSKVSSYFQSNTSSDTKILNLNTTLTGSSSPISTTNNNNNNNHQTMTLQRTPSILDSSTDDCEKLLWSKPKKQNKEDMVAAVLTTDVHELTTTSVQTTSPVVSKMYTKRKRSLISILNSSNSDIGLDDDDDNGSGGGGGVSSKPTTPLSITSSTNSLITALGNVQKSASPSPVIIVNNEKKQPLLKEARTLDQYLVIKKTPSESTQTETKKLANGMVDGVMTISNKINSSSTLLNASESNSSNMIEKNNNFRTKLLSCKENKDVMRSGESTTPKIKSIVDILGSFISVKNEFC